LLEKFNLCVGVFGHKLRDGEGAQLTGFLRAAISIDNLTLCHILRVEEREL
jgi:hypothetical protein